MYSIIAYIIYFVWKFFRKKDDLWFDDFLKLFIYKVCVILYTVVIIIWGFAYYSNEISPAKMPEYTISNWKKVVVFQAMSHIAKQDFYDKVRDNIRTFKSASWVYFYEWVKPGSKESSQKFDKALWINFTPDLYKYMSRLYWLNFQNNNDFLMLVNNLDFNVDLNLDEIVKIYEEKVKVSNVKPQENTEIVNVSEQLLNQLNNLNDKELKILVYLDQAIMNTVIKNDKYAKGLLKNLWNQNLFDVILDERNNNLTKAIINSKYDKIYITYWLLHFEWILNLLQENDKNWKIIKTKYLYPIK